MIYVVNNIMYVVTCIHLHISIHVHLQSETLFYQELYRYTIISLVIYLIYTYIHTLHYITLHYITLHYITLHVHIAIAICYLTITLCM